ncbi:MAG: beta-ketoacyl-ACP synthase [Xanthobacteraceae bacterium]
MAEAARAVLVTGIGLVSCLGEGPDAHWQRLMQARPCADTTTFAPYVVHPLAPIELDRQIPKKGDQRQMEPWQRIGTFAAGLALDSAGAKGNAALLARMDLIVAAGGGERDYAVDAAILTGLQGAERPGVFLNERLMSDLRPTLFLAQLSNLLAGNISIVHGVTGSSRTLMGEESAGVDAVRIALARIASGQSEIVLVGGAHNGERLDLLLLREAGGCALKGDFAPVFERSGRGGGLAGGSLGAFLVLESAEHAAARGARPLARLSRVRSERTSRRPGETQAELERMWTEFEPSLAPSRFALLSGATGAEPATAEERRFLEAHPGVPVRATGTYIGHAFDAQFPMNLALATLALAHGRLYPSFGSVETDGAHAGLTQIVVTSVGYWRGEGMALIEALP